MFSGKADTCLDSCVGQRLGCLQGVKKPTLPVQLRFLKKGSASSSGTDKPASQEVVAALPAEGKDGSNALPEKAKDLPLEEEMSSSEIDLAFLSQASIVSVGSLCAKIHTSLRQSNQLRCGCPEEILRECVGWRMSM